MALTKLGEYVVNTIGELPLIGSQAPEFVLTGNDLRKVKSESFDGKTIVLNIFPSIDTGVCSTSVRKFNQQIASFPNAVVLCVSRDLPFAMKRFCGVEGINNAITLSDFRNLGFAQRYGVELTDGAFKGLLARAVVVIDSTGIVTYSQLVPNIDHEPDYESALKAL